jgi:hypothetical protein
LYACIVQNLSVLPSLLLCPCRCVFAAFFMPPMAAIFMLPSAAASYHYYLLIYSSVCCCVAVPRLGAMTVAGMPVAAAALLIGQAHRHTKQRVLQDTPDCTARYATAASWHYVFIYCATRKQDMFCWEVWLCLRHCRMSGFCGSELVCAADISWFVLCHFVLEYMPCACVA